MDNLLSRRQLMRDVALTGTAVAAGVGLAACGGGSSDPSNSSNPGSGSGSGTGSGASGGAGGGANALAKTSDIPVGGGTIFADKKVVVTQPTAGTFKGFSTTCTHLGCQVDKVADGLIQCPCHGSRYSVEDGSVKAGPAPRPLPTENIKVEGSQIMLES